jgi:hypothetical protein
VPKDTYLRCRTYRETDITTLNRPARLVAAYPEKYRKNWAASRPEWRFAKGGDFVKPRDPKSYFFTKCPTITSEINYKDGSAWFTELGIIDQKDTGNDTDETQLVWRSTFAPDAHWRSYAETPALVEPEMLAQTIDELTDTFSLLRATRGLVSWCQPSRPKRRLVRISG